ncbi:MAG: hypothetical protein ACK52J_03435 [bacterium]
MIFTDYWTAMIALFIIANLLIVFGILVIFLKRDLEYIFIKLNIL